MEDSSQMIIIAARKSDLARLQAYRVGQAILTHHPTMKIEYRFRESLGDQKADDPLWKMPEKGVFTEDFRADLLAEKVDLVVHSWKDLPTEERPDTEIVASLEREDPRDVILWKKSMRLDQPKGLRILTSSPRRVWALEQHLPTLLPWKVDSLEFHTIRGNIQTRLRKFVASDCQGLVMAKAAVDRILASGEDEFRESRDLFRRHLKQDLDWMVLPLSLFPCAAAQGALAIEVKSSRCELKKILGTINHPGTVTAVETERKILKSYGGGCHQKIGVSVQNINGTELLNLSGQSDQGELLHYQGPLKYFSRLQPSPRTSPAIQGFEIYPPLDFHMEWARITHDVTIPDRSLWISKAEALPENYRPKDRQLVWCAGVSTWKKLARRGVFVNGTNDSLGENLGEGVQWIAQDHEDIKKSKSWVKLSHDRAPHTRADHDVIGTYHLQPKTKLPAPTENSKYCYWSSASEFRTAWTHYSRELKNLRHACGPGHTRDALLREGIQAEIFLSKQDWLSCLGVQFPKESPA